MRKFYNQETKKVKEFEDYQTLTMDINVPSFYGLKYYKTLDQKMNEFLKEQKATDKPTVFQIKGDFSLVAEHVDMGSQIDFLMSITNIFVSHLFTNERTEGEFRLSAPKALDEMKLSVMVKKDLANKKLTFPNFTVEVVNKDGGVIYGVL